MMFSGSKTEVELLYCIKPSHLNVTYLQGEKEGVRIEGGLIAPGWDMKYPHGQSQREAKAQPQFFFSFFFLQINMTPLPHCTDGNSGWHQLLACTLNYCSGYMVCLHCFPQQLLVVRALINQVFGLLLAHSCLMCVSISLILPSLQPCVVLCSLFFALLALVGGCIQCLLGLGCQPVGQFSVQFTLCHSVLLISTIFPHP